MRKDVDFKAPHHLPGVLIAAGGLPVCPPLARHGLKRVFGGGAGCHLVGLANGHRVIACRKNLARLIHPVAGLRERYIWICAQRHHLFFAQHPVFPAPQLGANRIDEQIEPLAVGQLDGLEARFCLFNCGVGQWHEYSKGGFSGYTPNRVPPYPQEYPRQASACNTPSWTLANKKAPCLGAFGILLVP